MIITDNSKPTDQQAKLHNDDSDSHKDEIGENTGDDTGLGMADKEEKENKKFHGENLPKKGNR